MFGNRLRKLRKEHKLTQRELGEKVSVSSRVIGYYESNERFPDKETLITLAEYFEVSLDYLLGRTNIKKLNNNSNTDIFNKINNLSVESLEEITKLIELYELKDNLSKGKESHLYQKKG